jgi:thiaminase/transcriptional activator TenA
MNHQDLIKACQREWDEYTQHEFVQLLGTGTLNQQAYLHYLKQDFLFLKQYARAYAMAIYKSRTLAEMRSALPSVQALLASEIGHHIEYCRAWGLSEADMEAEPEAFGTVAYTRYVLDTGMSGDLIDLYVALAPCSLGYGQIGLQLQADPTTLSQGNPYQTWIDLYSGDHYQQGMQQSVQQLDGLLSEIDVNSARAAQLCQVFKTATRMEIAFWQQGLDAIGDAQ